VVRGLFIKIAAASAYSVEGEDENEDRKRQKLLKGDDKSSRQLHGSNYIVTNG